jgi:hypothetical protein
MVLDQRKTQASNLLKKLGIEINPTKGLPGLSKRSLQQVEISDAWGATALRDQLAVKFKNFREVQPPHQASRR